MIIVDAIIMMILVLISGFFSSSETALTSISPHRVRMMKDEGLKYATTLEKVLNKKEKMLSVILICNNLVNIGASALMTIFVQNTFGNWAVGIGTGVLTLLVLIFGEVTPKTIATYKAEQLSLIVCPVIYVLMIIFTPAAAAVNFISGLLLRLFGIYKDQNQDTYTENEIRSIVEVSSEDGMIDNDEKDFINNVFDFNDTPVKEVMVPRINITTVNENSEFDEIERICSEYKFSRIPVYDENNDGFVGVLNIKDFLFIDNDEKKTFSVKKYMRPLLYTYEQKKLSELFVEMNRAKTSMMAVMDEYGFTVGIVTMTDLVEEIVGDIKDEYDSDEDEYFTQTGSHSYEIPGFMSLSDVNDKLGLDLESEDYESVGGLLMEKLDRMPEEGDVIRVKDATLTAVKVEGARIEKVRISKLKSDKLKSPSVSASASELHTVTHL